MITSEKPQELQTYQFGLTPYWAKKPMDLINARAEGDKNQNNDPNYQGPNQIFMKKAFMKPIQIQRCLVIADAYFEWSAAKKPFLVYLQNKVRPFAFAGLYDHWLNPETKEIVSSFTIITTTANAMLQKLGVKRMPVILQPGYEKDRIKPDKSLSQVLKLLRQFDSKIMNAYPVSDLINTPGINDASLIAPNGERLLIEIEPIRKTNTSHSYTHKKKDSPTGSWGESRKTN